MKNTYIPEGRVGWWGDLDARVRCTKDDKVAFASKELAQRSAAKIRERHPKKGDERMMAYLGRCGNWHVGHGLHPVIQPEEVAKFKQPYDS